MTPNNHRVPDPAAATSAAPVEAEYEYTWW